MHQCRALINSCTYVLNIMVCVVIMTRYYCTLHKRYAYVSIQRNFESISQ